MSYTIEQLNAAVESNEQFSNRWSNNWHTFKEFAESDWEPVLDADGNEVKEPASWNKDTLVTKHRDKGWKGVDLPGIGRAELIDEHGGMDQGSSYYFVFTVTDAAGKVRTFKRDGWYASHDGGYYDGPTYEAKPVERVVTEWVEA